MPSHLYRFLWLQLHKPDKQVSVALPVNIYHSPIDCLSAAFAETTPGSPTTPQSVRQRIFIKDNPQMDGIEAASVAATEAKVRAMAVFMMIQRACSGDRVLHWAFQPFFILLFKRISQH